MKEIDTFENKNKGNIYGTKPKFIGGVLASVAGINKFYAILAVRNQRQETDNK